MKPTITLRTAIVLATSLVAIAVLNAADWKPVPGHIMTQWADKVDPNNVLPEYPRPQLVRDNWVNLNGLWDYAVTKKDDPLPSGFEGKILVTFCIESALSGVKRKFTPGDRLWYCRTFTAPSLAKGERLILNFGAVDYEAAVFVNGKQLGTHEGGYDAFSFDITAALKPGANTLVVSVLDSTGGGPCGKQRVSAFDKPDGIFYTATSGIWQTVWLEKVPENYISSLKVIPDIDQGTLTVNVNGREGVAHVAVLESGKEVARQTGKAGEPIVLAIPEARLWSPESPFLYDLAIQLGSDAVKSYAGMRKISKGKDAKGVLRPMLNNKVIFLAGPLDQGFWPDGIYTAPTDEALKFDIEMTKRFGFNMTRKHIKVEPARWYYWIDKLGLLVWQDMPSDFAAGEDARGDRDGVPQSKEAADQFELELRTMVQQHFNSPSIMLWVVFNESWGQHDTPRLTKRVKDMDPTRLVTGGSGWFRAACGDVIDVHHYQAAARTSPEDDRIGVCGEFGGLGYIVPGRLWVPDQKESSVYIILAHRRAKENRAMNKTTRHTLIACATALLLAPLVSLHTAAAQKLSLNGPARLVVPLRFHDELVEVTATGTVRRRYMVRDEFAAEMAAWKVKADAGARGHNEAPRMFRLGCVFLKDATVTFSEIPGADGKPLRATFSTPRAFEETMRSRTALEYADFTWAFTGGKVKCDWVFETLSGLTWTGQGKNPGWGCQPRAIADQLEKALAKYKNAKVDMWVWCAGKPETLNGGPKQKVEGPPYGISYTQWPLFGGYNIAICAPHLPLVVHEVNHRYLDNLNTIEGVQLTQFHGLSMMGYEREDLGYPDLLATYRSVYLHIIRPDMWRRFSLTGPASAKPEPFTGKLYRWADVGDDCWFRLPLLNESDLARLTGLSGLKFIANRTARWRQFSVPDSQRSLLHSPYSATADDHDTALNNVLSLATESCAVLRTATGHWLIVRPEVAEVFVEMLSVRGKGAPLEAAGWLNEGICPLLVLRAPPELPVPAHEIGYFRPAAAGENRL